MAFEVAALLPDHDGLRAGYAETMMVGSQEYILVGIEEEELYYQSINPIRYELAKSLAYLAGGHLPIVETAEEQQFLIDAGAQGWLGHNRNASTDIWTPIQGADQLPDLDIHITNPNSEGIHAELTPIGWRIGREDA